MKGPICHNATCQSETVTGVFCQLRNRGVIVLYVVALDLHERAKDAQQQLPILKKVTHVFVDVYIAKIGAYCFDFTVYARTALRYFCNSSLTLGYKKNKPIIFGKTSAKIMASEKVQTADISPAAPITINNRNKIL